MRSENIKLLIRGMLMACAMYIAFTYVGPKIFSIYQTFKEERVVEKKSLLTAEKTIIILQSAAKKYYAANNTWPTDIATLQTAGYLPASFLKTTPWGGDYIIKANSADPKKVDITLILPSRSGKKLTRLLAEESKSGKSKSIKLRIALILFLVTAGLYLFLYGI